MIELTPSLLRGLGVGLLVTDAIAGVLPGLLGVGGATLSVLAGCEFIRSGLARDACSLKSLRYVHLHAPHHTVFPVSVLAAPCSAKIAHFREPQKPKPAFVAFITVRATRRTRISLA
jgi:uncharacterized membrane protein YfcA